MSIMLTILLGSGLFLKVKIFVFKNRWPLQRRLPFRLTIDIVMAEQIYFIFAFTWVKMTPRAEDDHINLPGITHISNWLYCTYMYILHKNIMTRLTFQAIIHSTRFCFISIKNINANDTTLPLPRWWYSFVQWNLLLTFYLLFLHQLLISLLWTFSLFF